MNAGVLLVRALTYASLFVALVLVFLPSRVLLRSGVIAPPAIGLRQIAGMGIAATGAALALWCVLVFVFVGRGTPAPFDPPRGLVVEGPYRFTRNPMYVGVGLAMAGAAVFYQSWMLLGYVGVLWLAAHSFIVWYEEPVLRRTFGKEYETYCRQVGRWVPKP